MEKYKQKKTKNIILKHIKNNAREYTILFVVFVIGIVMGIFFINHTNDSQRNEIMTYIETFIASIKENQQVNFIGLLKDSILKNILLAGILWFLGVAVTLVPLIYGVVCFRGFCLGYTISSAIAILGVGKGVLFSLTILLLQNLLLIPAMLAIAQSGIQTNKRILKQNKETKIRHSKENIKLEILRHSIFSLLMVGVLVASSFIEVYISTNLFIWVVNFI